MDLSINRNNNIPLMREDEDVDRSKEVREFLDKFFNNYFLFIAFMATATGKDFSEKHSIVMKFMFLLMVLYFLLCVAGTILGDRIDWFPKMQSWSMLFIACVASIMVSTLVSLSISLLVFLFCFGILATSGYYYASELYELIVSPIALAFKKLIQSYRGNSTSLPV